MIQIVMKPVPGQGVVNRESLYTALFNGEDIGMRVRALRASHAEQKVMEMSVSYTHLTLPTNREV